MKQPLMLIPPAQAEALYDAALKDEHMDQSFAPLPWRDDDSPEEISIRPNLSRPFPRHRSFTRQRAA